MAVSIPVVVRGVVRGGGGKARDGRNAASRPEFVGKFVHRQ